MTSGEEKYLGHLISSGRRRVTITVDGTTKNHFIDDLMQSHFNEDRLISEGFYDNEGENSDLTIREEIDCIKKQILSIQDSLSI